jgi:hypothetical protein
MSWLEHHHQSEQFASQAEIDRRQGNLDAARQNYALAAEAEIRALDVLEMNDPKTLGITAVSAVALLFKAKDFTKAKQVAYQSLSSQSLPKFAIIQLEEILKEILNLESAVAV